jgi:capsular polysaccharide biosynthesis protein
MYRGSCVILNTDGLNNVGAGTQDEEMTISIDFMSLFELLVSKIKMIVFMVVIFAVMGALVSKFVIVPKYTATVTFYVNNNKNSVSQNLSYSDLSAASMLVPTYIELIKSKSVLKTVEDKINTGFTSDQLASMISASEQGDDTQLMVLQVTNSNPENAYLIANAIADIAPTKIVELMDGSSVKVVDYAEMPTVPTSPNVTKNTMLAAILGLILSVGIIFLRYILETSIKSEDDIKRMFPNIPVIGVVPEIEAN